jgi:hypothetical protein
MERQDSRLHKHVDSRVSSVLAAHQGIEALQQERGALEQRILEFEARRVKELQEFEQRIKKEEQYLRQRWDAFEKSRQEFEQRHIAIGELRAERDERINSDFETFYDALGSMYRIVVTLSAILRGVVAGEQVIEVPVFKKEQQEPSASERS